MKRPDLLTKIEETFAIHPICALLGPRQAGKTTLARMYAEQTYPNDVFIFDLENPEDIERLTSPMIVFSQIQQSLIVIDEIQRRPDLFPVLRVVVDDLKNKHKFLILGSASRDLIQQSSESLAGRIGYVEVMPFSLNETHESSHLWLRGGFPRSYLAKDIHESVQWRKAYTTTFIEHDVPALGFQVPPMQLRRLWFMLAHYHGQILNASELGRSLDLSHHTVKKYIDILAGTFMIRILQPWFENISRRQVKSPKIYFRDSGILHSLLNIKSADELYTNPKVGASWEGFALEEVIRSTQEYEPFFWSTQSEAELDLYMMNGSKKIGFEFKYTDVPKITRSMHKAIEELKLDHLYIIVPGNKLYQRDEKITVCGLDSISEIFKDSTGV